jgi:hypothetical protein
MFSIGSPRRAARLASRLRQLMGWGFESGLKNSKTFDLPQVNDFLPFLGIKLIYSSGTLRWLGVLCLKLAGLYVDFLSIGRGDYLPKADSSAI